MTAQEAIDVLLALELCIDVTGEKSSPKLYQIPALLHDSIPGDAWVKDSELNVYRGQRYECDDPVDIISPLSLVIFQSRCSQMANVNVNVRCKLWRDGVIIGRIVNDKKVQCLIKMRVKNGRHFIDVIIRWSSTAACEVVAKEFLDELKEMITEACSETSPGVLLNWFYLDSSYLKQLREDPPIYSSSEVDRRVIDKTLNHILYATRPEGEDISCPIKDLVIFVSGTSLTSGMVEFVRSTLPFFFRLVSFPTDDESVSHELMRACAAVDGSKWEAIAINLGIELNDRKNIDAFTRPDYFCRMFKVLELWKKKAISPTVGQLLHQFNEIGISRKAIKDKFEQSYGCYH